MNETDISLIETERLIIKALNYGQLIKYIRLDNSLEKELNLFPSARTISSELSEALEQTILPNVADTTRNYLYSTIWTLISKSDNKMVGDLCFVGEPNSEGEVEIGYGVYEEFRKRGFMTEAVRAMIRWAEKQPDIKVITASTKKTNPDSSAILERNNFINCEETETLYKWRFEIGRAHTNKK